MTLNGEVGKGAICDWPGPPGNELSSGVTHLGDLPDSSASLISVVHSRDIRQLALIMEREQVRSRGHIVMGDTG